MLSKEEQADLKGKAISTLMSYNDPVEYIMVVVSGRKAEDEQELQTVVGLYGDVLTTPLSVVHAVGRHARTATDNVLEARFRAITLDAEDYDKLEDILRKEGFLEGGETPEDKS